MQLHVSPMNLRLTIMVWEVIAFCKKNKQKTTGQIKLSIKYKKIKFARPCSRFGRSKDNSCRGNMKMGVKRADDDALKQHFF